MKPARVSYSRVRNRVGRLLEGLAEPPVDVEAIALGLGAEIRVFRLERDISGILYREAARKVIVVNAAHSRARQRFTIAHELGHLLLHPGEPVHVDQGVRVNLRDKVSATAEEVDEIEANAFAANLLMPAEWLQRDISAMGVDLEDATEMKRLAERYGVSPQAMIIRLSALGSV